MEAVEARLKAIEERLAALQASVQTIGTTVQEYSGTQDRNQDWVVDTFKALFEHLKVPEPKKEKPGPSTLGGGAAPEGDKPFNPFAPFDDHGEGSGSHHSSEEERPVTPPPRGNRVSAAPSAPRKKVKMAIPSKYDGKNKGHKA